MFSRTEEMGPDRHEEDSLDLFLEVRALRPEGGRYLVQGHSRYDDPELRTICHLLPGRGGILRVAFGRGTARPPGLLDEFFPVGLTEVFVHRPPHPLLDSRAHPFWIGAHLWTRLAMDLKAEGVRRLPVGGREALHPFLLAHSSAYRSYPDHDLLWQLAPRGASGTCWVPFEIFSGLVQGGGRE